MKAIVHIGSPKAGSSSIQEFLFANRHALATQGIRFHRNVRGRGSQYEYPLAVLAHQGRLINGAAERARYTARTVDEALAGSDRYLAALPRFAEGRAEQVALFSSEHILPWLNTPDLIRAFDARFRAAFGDVRYVVYFRAPGDSVLSQYSERIKRGYTHTLDRFLSDRLRGLNIFRAARRWTGAVGKSRIDIRLFDRDALRGGDVVTDFCAACGIDPAGLDLPARVNTSLSAPGAECLRVLNGMIPELAPDGRENPLRADLLQAVESLSSDMPRLALTAAQHETIATHMAVPLGKFRKQFFPDRPHLFAPRPPRPASDPAEIDALALQVMARLLIKSRLGDLSALSRLDRRRALFHDPARSQTANLTGAPDAPDQQRRAGSKD